MAMALGRVFKKGEVYVTQWGASAADRIDAAVDASDCSKGRGTVGIGSRE
jgi:hypothetical protein